MDDEIEQVRRELRTTIRAARICIGLCLAAFIVSLIAGCASPDRQWEQIAIAVEQTQR